MERPQMKDERASLSQKPPVPQSYWRFLAEKLLLGDPPATNPFKSQASSVSTQVACATHRLREIVADNHMGHCTSASSSSNFVSTRGRESPVAKAQRRWSPCYESTIMTTENISHHHIRLYATYLHRRLRSDSTWNSQPASFDLDGSERSTVSIGSVDVSPCRPIRSMDICDSYVEWSISKPWLHPESTHHSPNRVHRADAKQPANKTSQNVVTCWLCCCIPLWIRRRMRESMPSVPFERDGQTWPTSSLQG